MNYVNEENRFALLNNNFMSRRCRNVDQSAHVCGPVTRARDDPPTQSVKQITNSKTEGCTDKAKSMSDGAEDCFTSRSIPKSSERLLSRV